MAVNVILAHPLPDPPRAAAPAPGIATPPFSGAAMTPQDDTPPWLASAVDHLASTLVHERLESGSARRRRRPAVAALILVLFSTVAVGLALALHSGAAVESPASDIVAAKGGSGALNLVRAGGAGAGWEADVSLAALAGALRSTTSRGDAAVREAAKYEAALRLTEHRLSEGALARRYLYLVQRSLILG